ncbi:MAG: hypothetical protein ACOYVD_07425 [Bacillota bacterium]
MLNSIIIGFAFGLFVSIINHQLVVRSYGNSGPDTGQASNFKKKFTTRVVIRYFLIFAALFLVRNNPPMLIAAGFGLTMVKNYILLQYILGKKGVS